MDNQKPSTSSKYEIGHSYGCLKIIERISKDRFKVCCNICGATFDLSLSALSGYKKNDTQHCKYCPKENVSRKYKPGEILGNCFELLSFLGGNNWKVRCIKCGKEQVQSISNMKKHVKDTCYFCEHPNAERNPKSFGGPKGVNLLPIEERIYNYYSSRILEQNTHKDRKYKEWKLTISEFSELIYGDCYYCGAPPSTDNSWNTTNKRITDGKEIAINGIDRVDPNKGYTKDNCVSCCKYCNRMKSDLSLEEFYKKISIIYLRSKGSTTIERHISEPSRVESSDSKQEESSNGL